MAGSSQRIDSEDSLPTLSRVRRQALQAVEELRRGLLNHIGPPNLKGSPAFSRGRGSPRSGGIQGETSLYRETSQVATTIVCRLLFLLCADARNLLPIPCGPVRRSSGTRGPSGVAAWMERAALRKRTKRTKAFRLRTKVDRIIASIDCCERLSDLKIGGFPLEVEVAERLLTRAFDLLSPTEAASDHVGSRPCRRDYAALGIRCLGDIYEDMLECSGNASFQGSSPAKSRRQSRRKITGSYYTPDHIVGYIVEAALGRIVRGESRPGSGNGKPLSSEEILGLRVVDPAMGAGHFLLEATDYLARAYTQALSREGRAITRKGIGGSDPVGYKRLVAEHCIYGVDIDPMAVELAKLSLWLLTSESGCWPTGLERHLKCGNSLLGASFAEDCEAWQVRSEHTGYPLVSASGKAGGAFHWRSEFPEICESPGGAGTGGPGFDAVIGNPPYLSFSGRHKTESNEWVRSLPRARSSRGWLTTHGLFMLRALELVRESGLVAMIVPDQVGHLDGYAPIRSQMLDVGRLVEIKYWGESVFEGVTTPALTFVFEKGRNRSQRRAVVIGRDGSKVPFRPCKDGPWYDSRPRRIYQEALVRHRTLAGFSDSGVHTGNVAAKLILSSPGEGAVPVIEGRQVHPFRCDPPKRWLDHTYRARSGEYFRIAPAATYAKPDILIRQTASRPIAARHVFKCLYRNSVLALKVPDGFSVEYVLGILNSEPAGFLYRASSFESSQRAFPQVKVGQLRRLPIPDPTVPSRAPLIARIEEIVRDLEARSDGIDDTDPDMCELNDLAHELYGLSKDQAMP